MDSGAYSPFHIAFDTDDYSIRIAAESVVMHQLQKYFWPLSETNDLERTQLRTFFLCPAAQCIARTAIHLSWKSVRSRHRRPVLKRVLITGFINMFSRPPSFTRRTLCKPIIQQIDCFACI